MTKRKVSVERHIEQVCDGTHYKGYVNIAGIKLDYEIVFKVSIERLDDMEPAEYEDKIRHFFQITLKRGNEKIKLTKKEYMLFLLMISELAVNLYNNPQTRYSNEDCSLTPCGEGPTPAFGASVPISMTISGSYNFPLKVCKMLSAPKFGCALVAA